MSPLPLHLGLNLGLTRGIRVIGLSDLLRSLARGSLSICKDAHAISGDDLFRQWSRKMQPSLRILVVEDLHDSADSLGLLLSLWGYQAVITYEGAGALAADSATPPDVVFLDIGLPGMDGCEVARQLRRLPGTAHSLLVAVTGHGEAADVQRCKEAGIDYHFLKPVDPAELQRLLAKAENLGREQLAK
jgi:CheY-like chemotaxis protein